MTECWVTFWTWKGMRFMCDWDDQKDAAVHATILSEAGRLDVSTLKREEMDIPAELEERVRKRLEARAAARAYAMQEAAS